MKLVSDKIKYKPKAFYKKLMAYAGDITTYSVLFKDWYLREEGYRIEEIMEYTNQFPELVSEVSSIIRTLEEKYPDVDFDYGNETYVSLAIKLHKNHRLSFIKYLKKKVEKGLYKAPEFERETAWKEFAYRGFIPLEFLKVKRANYYIVTTIGGLCFPKNFETDIEAYEFGIKFAPSSFIKILRHPKLK